MCPLYVAGLIGPGDRKSVQPMAARLAPGDDDQLHHFIADGVWDAAPLETELLIQAGRVRGRRLGATISGDRPELAAQLGARRAVLRLSRERAPDHLHDKRHRGAELKASPRCPHQGTLPQ